MTTEALIQGVTKSLCSAALRHVPPDTLHAKDVLVTATIDASGTSIDQRLDEQAHRLRAIMDKLAQRREAAEKQI